MNEYERSKLAERMSALTEEEQMITVKYIPSEIMLAELAMRLNTSKEIINSVKQAVSTNGGE